MIVIDDTLDSCHESLLLTGSTSSSRLISCFNTLYLFCKVKPNLLIPHAGTIQPYLDIKCSVSVRSSCAASIRCYGRAPRTFSGSVLVVLADFVSYLVFTLMNLRFIRIVTCAAHDCIT